MDIHQAKQIPLYELLSKLGHEPIKKKKGGVEWVYLSPFRAEKEPSFFVNIKKNVWYDFGDSGGNGLDFVMQFKNTDVKGALAFLDEVYLFGNFKPSQPYKAKKAYKYSSEQKTLILDSVMPLKSPILENYLTSRAIDISIARKFVQVIQFHHASTKKKYFGIGIKNLEEGYEVRNPKIKTVVGKKAISFFKANNENTDSISVFESFLDFLSHLTSEGKKDLDMDVLILNSTSMAERAKTFIEAKDYQKVYTFFDNDRAGEKAKDVFMSFKNDIIPCNYIYNGFKDYNEYLISKSVL